MLYDSDSPTRPILRVAELKVIARDGEISDDDRDDYQEQLDGYIKWFKAEDPELHSVQPYTGAYFDTFRMIGSCPGKGNGNYYQYRTYQVYPAAVLPGLLAVQEVSWEDDDCPEDDKQKENEDEVTIYEPAPRVIVDRAPPPQIRVGVDDDCDGTVDRYVWVARGLVVAKSAEEWTKWLNDSGNALSRSTDNGTKTARSRVVTVLDDGMNVGQAINYRKEYDDAKQDCKKPKPAGGGFGDPHLRTLDGLAYDMQSVGEFHLVRIPDHGVDIQARFSPVSGFFIPPGTGSEISHLAFRLNGFEVELDKRGRAIVNGEPTRIPNDGWLYFNGGATILRFDERVFRPLPGRRRPAPGVVGLAGASADHGRLHHEWTAGRQRRQPAKRPGRPGWRDAGRRSARSGHPRPLRGLVAGLGGGVPLHLRTGREHRDPHRSQLPARQRDRR